ncbi:hypothetical protein VTH06DRAFT_4716 [Thermothelomyces fergusii]
MRNPLALLSSVLTLAATAALALDTSTLQPWQITRLWSHSASGYPGSHPYSRLSFEIREPNTVVVGETGFGAAAFAPSAVNCTVWWLGYASVGESPRGWVNTCDEMDTRQGKWTFEVLEGTGGGLEWITADFGLRVTLEEGVVLQTGGVLKVKFEGEAAFKVGENMAGACGASGVCDWGLKAELVPVLVRQRLVGLECVFGTCESA